jgi:DhnA family fructose-bisphosphate aldolase class Ia
MSGTRIRTSQLFNRETGKAVMVAFDHGGSGIPPGGADAIGIVEAIARSSAEALLVGPGLARIAGDHFARPGAPRLIVALDAPVFSPLCGEHGKIQSHARVATAEHAMRLGATAGKVLLPVGYESAERFAAGIALVRELALECERLGLPLMIEPALWGVNASEKDDALIEHSARVAIELGADILKIPAPTELSVLARIVRHSPVPVTILGGAPRDTMGLARDVGQWLSAGVVGVVVGRNVWSRPKPEHAVDALIAAVHQGDADAVERHWAAAGTPAA